MEQEGSVPVPARRAGDTRRARGTAVSGWVGGHSDVGVARPKAWIPASAGGRPRQTGGSSGAKRHPPRMLRPRDRRDESGTRRQSLGAARGGGRTVRAPRRAGPGEGAEEQGGRRGPGCPASGRGWHERRHLAGWHAAPRAEGAGGAASAAPGGASQRRGQRVAGRTLAPGQSRTSQASSAARKGRGNADSEPRGASGGACVSVLRSQCPTFSLPSQAGPQDGAGAQRGAEGAEHGSRFNVAAE